MDEPCEKEISYPKVFIPGFDLKVEKNSKLSTQEIYNILDTAIEECEDNGFMNSFVFYRLTILHAIQFLYPEKHDEIKDLILENNPINAFHAMLIDGAVEKVLEEFPIEMRTLIAIGEQWYREYTAFLHSVRGVFEEFRIFSGDIMDNASKQYASLKGSRVDEAIEAAKYWGMDETTEHNSNVIQLFDQE